MTPSREAIGFPALALGEHDGEGILPHDQGPKEVGEGAGALGMVVNAYNPWNVEAERSGI